MKCIKSHKKISQWNSIFMDILRKLQSLNFEATQTRQTKPSQSDKRKKNTDRENTKQQSIIHRDWKHANNAKNSLQSFRRIIEYQIKLPSSVNIKIFKSSEKNTNKTLPCNFNKANLPISERSFEPPTAAFRLRLSTRFQRC